MPGGAIAGAVGLYTASRASKASKDASKAMTSAADQSSQTMLQMFNQNRADLAPFRQAGLSGLNEYLANMGLSPVADSASNSALSGVSPEDAYLLANPDVARDPYYGSRPWDHYLKYGNSEGRTWGEQQQPQAQPAAQGYNAQTQQQAFDKFRATPGYQFGLTEGQKAVETSAAARGGLFSGAAGKALQKFGNDYADQQGYAPYMNRLASLAGIGQTATTQTGQWGQQTASNIGANLLNAGQTRASGLLGSAGAMNSGVAGLAGAFNNWWSGQDKSLNGGWYLGNNPGRG